ncbi:helix-turn-helix transcriptional regulator [Xanthomonas cannabis]|uniref:helix-turn-helix transcriptional regulator n=1 Tax=Xanthomonas cannabis TaxID=1885674 RepID=UPI00141BD249|nr:AlpA family phage regulatory protein [Xanthomonas cannabis]
MNPHQSDTILREKQVISVTGLGRSSVWAFGNPKSRYYDPTFPKPSKLGARAVGWKASEVFQWVASRSQLV